MSGGIWVHRVDRCGGPASVIAKALKINADRLIIKTRDGRSAYNDPDAALVASMAMAEGLSLWVWSWPYAATKAGESDYVSQQAELLCEDALRMGAAGICLNIEAPFSWAPNHRWGDLHRELWGQKASRKRMVRDLTRRLITDVKAGACGQPVAVSTFPIPKSHATASDLMAQLADEIWPQCYFKGSGWQSKVNRAVDQWTDLGAKVIRFTGPGWRGPSKMRSMVSAVEERQGPAPVDFWVMDKMDDEDLEAAAAIISQECRL